MVLSKKYVFLLFHFQIKGVLTGVARELFKSDISFEVVSVESQTAPDGQHLEDHVMFIVTMEKGVIGANIEDVVLSTDSLYSKKGLVGENDICSFLPYHMVIDKDLNIVQVNNCYFGVVHQYDKNGKKGFISGLPNKLNQFAIVCIQSVKTPQYRF